MQEKDLGPQSSEIVGGIGQDQIDSTWKQVEEDSRVLEMSVLETPGF
ncbi:hypothetical protein [Edaphobacter modestus]